MPRNLRTADPFAARTRLLGATAPSPYRTEYGSRMPIYLSLIVLIIVGASLPTGINAIRIMMIVLLAIGFIETVVAHRLRSQEWHAEAKKKARAESGPGSDPNSESGPNSDSESNPGSNPGSDSGSDSDSDQTSAIMPPAPSALPTVVITALIALEFLLGILAALWLNPGLLVMIASTAIVADANASNFDEISGHRDRLDARFSRPEKTTEGYHKGCLIALIYPLLVLFVSWLESRHSALPSTDGVSVSVGIITFIALMLTGWIIWANDSLVLAWRRRLNTDCPGSIFTHHSNPLRPFSIILIAHGFGGFVRLMDAFAIMLVVCGVAQTLSLLF